MHIGDELIQGIVNQKAIEALKPERRALYPYDDIEGFGKKAQILRLPAVRARGRPTPQWSDWQAEYERFKTA